MNRFFIVDEREVAIKFRLGEIVRSYDVPGLYLMIPFINNVKKYDSRLLTMDSKPEQFLTSEKKNVIVDFPNCDMTFVQYWHGLDTIGFCGKYNVIPFDLKCGKIRAVDRPHHIQEVENQL